MANSNLTVFPTPAQAPQTIQTPQEISQGDLTFILATRLEVERLQTRLAESESKVKAALETGATVEPGTHLARLVERFRASIPWKEKAVDLATRLGLNGPAWAKNVLSHTKKARTVSLFVA